MKKSGWAIVATGVVFFVSILVISPIMSNLGYSSVESSYHLWTHALLGSLIFTVIVCTMIIIEEINDFKTKLNDDKKNSDYFYFSYHNREYYDTRVSEEVLYMNL